MTPAFTAMLFVTDGGLMISVKPGWVVSSGSRAQAATVFIMEIAEAEQLAKDLLAEVERARKDSET